MNPSHPVKFTRFARVGKWQCGVTCFTVPPLEALLRPRCVHGRCGPQIPLRSRDTFTFYLMCRDNLTPTTIPGSY